MSHARWSMRRKARSSGIALQLFLLPLEIHWTRRSPGEKIFLRDQRHLQIVFTRADPSTNRHDIPHLLQVRLLGHLNNSDRFIAC
ncbi:hypothetical protein M758_11G121900 [Ceratodon purpureus]|nr:hypothetical protein M758_11G121900 [Ceratodon purpureus]